VDFFRPRDVSLLGLIKGSLSGSGNAPAAAPAALQSQAAGMVQSQLTVTPVPGSRLVDLSYKDPNPSRAERIANAYAGAYVASNLDKRFEANSYAKTFLDDQIKQLKIRLEESQNALLEFSEREKMVEVNDKASIAESNLATANAAAGQLIGERMKNEQLWRQVENTGAINLPQFLSNAVIETLRAQRKALETEYQEKLENSNPAIQRWCRFRTRSEADRQLAAEVKTIKSSPPRIGSRRK
jgi:uncharacterized protein involved in exopolysaccharide biosynthesis